MTPKSERFTAGKVDRKQEGEGLGRFVGYAAKWHVLSRVMRDPAIVDDDGNPVDFCEEIDRHCFDVALSLDVNIRALYDHNKSNLLGTTESGTLRLTTDDVGLKFEVDIPDTSWARDAVVLVDTKRITGSSFRFTHGKWAITERPGQPAIARLVDCRIVEVSPAVVFPAYDDTEVQVREFTGYYVPAAGVLKPRTPRLNRARRRLRIEDF